MSFQQGLSGLNSSSKALDVLGNNIANANTVGFKSAEVHFSDVFANSLSGSGASQVGIGATISGIQQSFSQGNVTATNNPLDISINGGGFFRMSLNGAITYTRNGQFHLDNAGFIINDQQMKVTGYVADAASGVISASSPEPIQLSASQINPRATNNPLAGPVTAALNLNAGDKVKGGAATPTPFALNNPESYNFSTALSVYDTLGVAHTLTMYFQRAPTTVAPITESPDWKVYGTLDGKLPDGAPTPPTPFTTLNFNTSGVLPTAMPNINLPTWTLTSGAGPFGPPDAASGTVQATINFTGTTQFGSASSVDSLTQGGYASGSLTGLSAGADGVIQGRYSNGQARDLGQIVLATFANPNGLQSLGNNQWALSSISGPELVSAPGTGSRGVLQSSSIEESNVDLTKQLVDMITQQRNYQANAQTIKTQDQIMQTLVNLR